MTAFAVSWDYRCPFARNAHEHVIEGLRSGADWDVTFVPFSLNQVHVAEGDPDVWDDPSKATALLAMQVGIVVRDRFPDEFLDVHVALFRARHEEGRDIREASILREILTEQGVDADKVFAEIDDEWPLEQFRKEHERGGRAPGVGRADVHPGRPVGVRTFDDPPGGGRGDGHEDDRAGRRPARWFPGAERVQAHVAEALSGLSARRASLRRARDRRCWRDLADLRPRGPPDPRQSVPTNPRSRQSSSTSGTATTSSPARTEPMTSGPRPRPAGGAQGPRASAQTRGHRFRPPEVEAMSSTSGTTTSSPPGRNPPPHVSRRGSSPRVRRDECPGGAASDVSPERARRRARRHRGGQQRAHVEQQVGHLVGGHQLTVPQIAQALVDDGQGLADHLVERTGLGHAAHHTGVAAPRRHDTSVTHREGVATGRERRAPNRTGPASRRTVQSS